MVLREKDLTSQSHFQARDANSQLRLGCIVMGPAFHDEAGAWDTIKIYLSSSYGEFHAERRCVCTVLNLSLSATLSRFRRLHVIWTVHGSTFVMSLEIEKTIILINEQ